MMDENVFKSADSVVAMVADAGEDLTAATVQELYNAFYNKIDEAKKDAFWKERIADDWQIAIKKSAMRYRDNVDIMLDFADMWLRSNSMTRDDICRMVLGVSSKNKYFFKMMDCYHWEQYRVEITDAEKDSIFSSVDSLERALDETMDTEWLKRFIPSNETMVTVYKYVQFTYNRAIADADLRKRISEMGIDTENGFCKMFEDLVICYGKADCHKKVELEEIFYRGIPFNSLGFTNVMDRLYEFVLKGDKKYE